MIDYEKVSMNLLAMIQQLNGIQNFLGTPELSSISGTKDFVFAIDAFRKKVAEEIERQGS